MITDEMIEFESGQDSPEDRRWYAWLRQVETLLGVETIDGDQQTEGYSLDYALEAFQRQQSPLEYARDVNTARTRLGLRSFILDAVMEYTLTRKIDPVTGRITLADAEKL
jgi:hypothetical protein